MIKLKDKYNNSAEFFLEIEESLFILNSKEGLKEYILIKSIEEFDSFSEKIDSFKAIGNKALIQKVMKIAQIEDRAERLIETHSQTLIHFDGHKDRISFKPVILESEIKNDVKSRVLIVDDSAVIRKLLTKIVNSSESLEVVYAASSPNEAKEYLKDNKVDIITLDIHMPEMDGVTLFKTHLKELNIPTVIISSMSIQEGPLVMEALSAGVLAYIEKPDAININLVEKEIITQLEVLSKRDGHTEVQSKVKQNSEESFIHTKGLVTIGSSTGGTQALETVLTQLPQNIPPVLIVQHIPEVFSNAFAQRLDSVCPFKVKEVEEGEKIEANTVYIAKGGKQFKVKSRGDNLYVVLTDDASDSYNFKPSVDYLFESLIDLKIKNMVAVILTGMGRDGSKSLLELRKNGAYTIGQSASSCVVYGMPKVAFELGACMEMTHVDDISESIVKAYNKL